MADALSSQLESRTPCRCKAVHDFISLSADCMQRLPGGCSTFKSWETFCAGVCLVSAISIRCVIEFMPAEVQVLKCIDKDASGVVTEKDLMGACPLSHLRLRFHSICAPEDCQQSGQQASAVLRSENFHCHVSYRSCICPPCGCDVCPEPRRLRGSPQAPSEPVCQAALQRIALISNQEQSLHSARKQR